MGMFLSGDYLATLAMNAAASCVDYGTCFACAEWHSDYW